MVHSDVKWNSYSMALSGGRYENISYTVCRCFPANILITCSGKCCFGCLLYIQIEEDTDRDNFKNSWEAKEYGLVDDVIDDGKPGLVAPIAEFAPPPKTRVWEYWKVEGSKKAKKNLPSEQALTQKSSQGGDGGQAPREPTPV